MSDLCLATILDPLVISNVQNVIYFTFGWIVRELSAIPVYIYAYAGTIIEWRGKQYRINNDGTAEPCKKNIINSQAEHKNNFRINNMDSFKNSNSNSCIKNINTFNYKTNNYIRNNNGIMDDIKHNGGGVYNILRNFVFDRKKTRLDAFVNIQEKQEE